MKRRRHSLSLILLSGIMSILLGIGRFIWNWRVNSDFGFLGVSRRCLLKRVCLSSWFESPTVLYPGYFFSCLDCSGFADVFFVMGESSTDYQVPENRVVLCIILCVCVCLGKKKSSTGSGLNQTDKNEDERDETRIQPDT